MPPQEQAELWMALRDRMKNDWHDLTLQERKAGKCAFGVGPHGLAKHSASRLDYGPSILEK
jgi:cytochrome c oxidase subunit 4